MGRNMVEFSSQYFLVMSLSLKSSLKMCFEVYTFHLHYCWKTDFYWFLFWLLCWHGTKEIEIGLQLFLFTLKQYPGFIGSVNFTQSFLKRLLLSLSLFFFLSFFCSFCKTLGYFWKDSLKYRNLHQPLHFGHVQHSHLHYLKFWPKPILSLRL